MTYNVFGETLNLAQRNTDTSRQWQRWPRFTGIVWPKQLIYIMFYFMFIIIIIIKQDAQLSQRDRPAGCVIVLTKSGRLEVGDNISAPAPRGGFWRLSLPSALLKPAQILKRATKIW